MWIARDRSAGTYIYTNKPNKEGDGQWHGNVAESFDNLSEKDRLALESVYNNLSWADPEPTEIGFTLNYSLDEIKDMSKEYEESIRDTDYPLYTPEDLRKAYEEAFKKAIKICG